MPTGRLLISMSRWLVERRLTDSSERLKRLRTDIEVAKEQLAALAETADDARLRALVSETPQAVHDHSEAQRHADAMSHNLAVLTSQVHELERSQDELLDRLSAGSSPADGDSD